MAQFLSNLPNRALIKFGRHSVGSETAQPIIWMVADKNHSGYPTNSVTLITQKIIDLRAFDAKEAPPVAGGNNNYRLSNINSWLNSDASAGNWYSPTHGDDTPPTTDATTSTSHKTGYVTRPGFLYNFTTAEKLALLPTTLMIKPLNDVLSSMVAKVFLPSMREILGTYPISDESSRLACFTTGNVTSGLTTQAYTNTASSVKPTTVDDAWSYWSRNIYTTTSTGDVSIITASGEVGGGIASTGNIGVRPIINIPANTKISDTTDGDGCYTFIPNSAPIIDGANSDLGIKNSGFSQNYTVNDTENDTVTVTEYIDNVKIRSYVATLGTSNTFAVTGNTWLKLANGIHTLKITATDGFLESSRVYTFTKSVNTLVVQRVTPLTSITKPSRLVVTVVKSIPPEAKFKVEACNNGFDTTPTWEDITSSITSGQVHVFSNTVKTAATWGVNIRVTVDRNGSEGACYITEIGGNFE